MKGFGMQDATIGGKPSIFRKGKPMANFIRIVLSVLLPPVGVFLRVGLGLHFWLNIVLTLCGYIPGLVHAVWIIARCREQPQLA